MFEILRYPELDSTNEEAKRLLNAGRLTTPTIIVAECQTAGKGTQGRQWYSPPGAGLYMSIVHPVAGPEWHTGETIPLTPLFTLAAGVACAEAINTLTGVSIGLKPINDLYIEGRKLGGILTESIISYETAGHAKANPSDKPLANAQNPEPVCRALITGIGINILPHPEIKFGCQRNARHRPISLQDCLPGAVFNQLRLENILNELIEAIGRAVHNQYKDLLSGNRHLVLEKYGNCQVPGIELPEELRDCFASRRK